VEVKELSAKYVARSRFKQTEVGLIPEDWAVRRIESITSDISMGPFGSDIKVSNFISEGVPVLNGANVRSERLRDSFANFVSPAKAKSLKKAVAHRGDIVVTHRGTLGQISHIPENSAFDRYVISQSQFRVRFIESLATPAWVVLYFHSKQGAASLLEGKGHTGVPAIAQPTKTFRNLQIPLPPLSEQRAITKALGDADALIESLEQLLAKRRQVKQGAMQELLTGKRRLPGFSGVWRTKQLSEVCSMRSGEQVTDEDIDEHSEFPCYGGNGLRGFTKTFTHDGGYALIGRQGALCGNVLSVGGRFFASEHAIVVTAKKETNIHWLSYVLARMNLNRYSESSAQPGLSVSKLLTLESTIPSLSEQAAIAAVFLDIDAEIIQLDERLAKTRNVKQGVMQELLTGRVRLL
jgi:type I restriction enzyme, S subunit